MLVYQRVDLKKKNENFGNLEIMGETSSIISIIYASSFHILRHAL
jgi:hypothetical protein